MKNDTMDLFFDHFGRRIPKNLQADVRDANRDFFLESPSMSQKSDFANRLLRLEGCLSAETGITAQQFYQETKRLIELIEDNHQIGNLAKGVWLPLVLPKLVITDDLGSLIEYLLAGVNSSYTKTFKDRTFNNYRKGDLSGKVSIIEGSRRHQLIEKLKQGPVVGIHFPNPLQGFSVNASREQMATLSEGFILSGIDAIIAMIMYPDILARDYNAPGLDLAAFSWGSPAVSLYFRAFDGSLAFNHWGYLCYANDFCSSGLLFLGEC